MRSRATGSVVEDHALALALSADRARGRAASRSSSGCCSAAASRSTSSTASSTLIAMLLVVTHELARRRRAALEIAARAARRAAAARAGSTSAAPGCRTSRARACCSPFACCTSSFYKEPVLAHHASPLFRAAPYRVRLHGARRRDRPDAVTDLPLSPAATRSRWSACSRSRASSFRLPRWTSAPPSARWAPAARCWWAFLAEPALLMVLFTASLITPVDARSSRIVDKLAQSELAIYPSLAFAGVAFTMVLAGGERARAGRQSRRRTSSSP